MITIDSYHGVEMYVLVPWQGILLQENLLMIILEHGLEKNENNVFHIKVFKDRFLHVIW